MKIIKSRFLVAILILSPITSLHADSSWGQWIKNGLSRLSSSKTAKISGGLALGFMAYYIIGYYTHTLCPHMLRGNNLLNYLRSKYKPGKNKCGAAVTQAPDRLPDNIWAKVICLVDGYIDIAYVGSRDLTPAIKQVLKKANIEIIQFKISGWGDEVILHTTAGKTNALLLQKYITTLPLNEDANHYLVGKLLKYDETDIQYFYSRNYGPQVFIDRQKAAIEWLAENNATLEQLCS